MTFAQRVALLTALAARRKATARSKYIADTDGDSEGTSGADTPQSILLAKRRREVLLKLLDELPEATAEALALHFVLGMTIDEIASAANAPVNTIWSRLRLGKQALRRKLETDASAAAVLAEAL
jgi:RNA polymerase sigma-70 factor (ECF subfamily)